MSAIQLQRQTKNTITAFHIHNDVPVGVNRLPVSLSLVIDTSGSMNTNATSGSGEQTELTILEIVVHTCKAIINSLEDYDELAIIQYSSVASVVLPIQKMTKKNKEEAIKRVDNLVADGTTNIYDGMKKTLDLLKDNVGGIKNRYIYLLSDGDPNVEPPRGTLEQLRRDLHSEYTLNRPMINTFGFGYGVKSELMKNISDLTQGSYGFIPDANFVGTVIINNLANTLCNYYKNIVLTVELQENTNVEILDKYNYTITRNELKIVLPVLKLGNDRNILVSTDKPILKSSLSCSFISENKEINVVETQIPLEDEYIMYESFKQKFIILIDEIMKKIGKKKSSEKIQILADEITAYLVKKDKTNIYVKHLNELLNDINGEVKGAVDDSAFLRWGEKYLPSLQNAHFTEETNNFKDSSIQHYGGDFFQRLQEKFEKIFIGLPDLKPKNIPAVVVANAVPLAYNSLSFYDRAGTCVDGNCLLKMGNGEEKFIKDVLKGEVVWGGDTIECVLRTKCKDGMMEYCKTDSGLAITKYHPMKYNGEIVFPKDVLESQLYESEYMYTLLLKNRQAFVIINDFEVIALAHNIQNDDVARHSYFGTEAIVEQLKQCQGWDKGVVTFESSLELFERDNDNDQIVSINTSYEIV